MKIKLLLAGDGGQGVQSLADIICRAAFSSDRFVSFIPNYGLEQRGGVSLAYVQISDREISYPKFTEPDILLLMSDQADHRTIENQTKKTKMIRSSEYENIFQENNISGASQNIFFLGVLTKILLDKKMIEEKQVRKVLQEKLSKKDHWESNLAAFEKGLKAVH